MMWGPMPEPDAATDQQLLSQMAQGHEDALRELHRRHAGLLYGLGYRMLRQREDVENCVQDAFLSAWRHAGRYDPGLAAPRTWLVSIAHHRFLQELRDRPDAGLELGEWQVARTADPLPPVVAGQALDALDAQERSLVELAFYRGHSHSELSRITGLSLGTVKSRLRVSLRRMRGALGGGEHEP